VLLTILLLVSPTCDDSNAVTAGQTPEFLNERPQLHATWHRLSRCRNALATAPSSLQCPWQLSYCYTAGFICAVATAVETLRAGPILPTDQSPKSSPADLAHWRNISPGAAVGVLETKSVFCCLLVTSATVSAELRFAQTLAISVSVCLSVCLFVCPLRISPNFLCILHRSVAVDRSCPDGNVIRYVLPVLWMTSCFHCGANGSESKMTRMSVFLSAMM